MSHELTTHKDGRVEFAFLKSDGEPWHGLGQPMEENQSIDDWRVAAGMDWKIQRSKVRYATDLTNDFQVMPEQHVLFRSDTKAALGLVSEKYRVVQPRDVLEFFRDIAKAGGLELSAAGTIYNGKRFWATAKIGEASPASVKDKVGGYLLISTSADGSLATEVRRTTIRTVCRNTLAMAFTDAKSSVKVSHRSVWKPEEVKEFMGLNEAAWEAFRHQVTRLANIEIVDEQADLITADLFGGGDVGRNTSGYRKVIELFSGAAMGADLDGVRGTAWGLLNAVTEYADHHVRSKTDEHRFVSSQWGHGADLKDRALRTLLAA